MRTRLLVAAAAAALTAFAAGAAPAGAAVAWSPCSPAGFQCGALTVPLDRTGGVAGAVTLRAERAVAASNPTRTAVVALAGGPGQAALPAATDFASILAPALAERDLLVFDQRGTGRSDKLSCPSFVYGDVSIVAAARGCALELGAARGFYRTADSVADLEDLRREGGYDNLVLFGVSYGTKVALDYAAAHPDHTAGLVLDSIVPPEGADVLRRPTFAAVGRVLRELCASGRCRGITASVTSDLSALVRRTEGHALRGRVTTPSGRRVPASVGPYDLYRTLLAGDLNPGLRARLPAALHAALRGDADPILRLGQDAGDSAGGAQAVADTTTDSEALFAATRCAESTFPWNPAADANQRAREASAAARRMPRSAFAPFSPEIALVSEVIPLCLGWPDAGPGPGPPGPLPAVPTLLLAGRADLRTPLEGARAIAARIPGAALVEVPDVGHSVLGSDFGNCARDAVAAFFAGAPQPPCRGRSLMAPTPVPPASFGAVRGATPAAKTINALRATLADVSDQFTSQALATGRLPHSGTRAGGLRSGTAVFQSSGIRLRREEVVPGVVVSGFLPAGQGASASFVITGRSALHGSVRLGADGHLSGRLGGRPVGGTFRVSARAARASARAAPPRTPVLHGIG